VPRREDFRSGLGGLARAGFLRPAIEVAQPQMVFFAVSLAISMRICLKA